MDRQVIIDLMADRQLFAGASPELLGYLVDHGSVETIEVDTLMIEQGKLGEAVWVLLSGSVAIIVDGDMSHSLDSPGTILGEISAVSHTAATATVLALEEISALKIPHQDFHQALTQSEDLAQSVLRSLAKYL